MKCGYNTTSTLLGEPITWVKTSTPRANNVGTPLPEREECKHILCRRTNQFPSPLTLSCTMSHANTHDSPFYQSKSKQGKHKHPATPSRKSWKCRQTHFSFPGLAEMEKKALQMLTYDDALLESVPYISGSQYLLYSRHSALLPSMCHSFFPTAPINLSFLVVSQMSLFSPSTVLRLVSLVPHSISPITSICSIGIALSPLFFISPSTTLVTPLSPINFLSHSLAPHLFMLLLPLPSTLISPIQLFAVFYLLLPHAVHHFLSFTVHSPPFSNSSLSLLNLLSHSYSSVWPLVSSH